jgi:hypothetical protein
MIDWTNVTGTYLTFKKSNPQVLPPAGRNFYDSTDELMFENAQRIGAFAIESPVEYTRSLRNLKHTIGDTNKRSGKKLFVSNLVNAHPAYTPLQIESPSGVTDKFDLSNNSTYNPNASQTINHRLHNKNNKLNGKINNKIIFNRRIQKF